MLNFRRLRTGHLADAQQSICLPLIYLMVRHPRVFGSLNFERIGRLLPFFDHIFLELSRQTLLSEFRGYLRYYVLA